MSTKGPHQLLPDAVKAVWDAHAQAGATASADPWQAQQDLIAVEARTWAEALQMGTAPDLKRSLLDELCAYTGAGDLDAIERRCRGAVAAVRDEWQRGGTDPADATSVETFYDRSEAYLFDLMWWHTLVDDPSPLAYLVALRFAQSHGCTEYLDFGSGVGSAGILFARHGFRVTLADISSSLLRFAEWRLRRREIPATLIDLKGEHLPDARFEIVTAMDVWEHLVDPVATVDQLAAAIVPGGFLFGRFAAQSDPEYPQHIVTNFGATFAQLAARGFVEVWRDDWLWGHQAFQKRR